MRLPIFPRIFLFSNAIFKYLAVLFTILFRFYIQLTPGFNQHWQSSTILSFNRSTFRRQSSTLSTHIEIIVQSRTTDGHSFSRCWFSQFASYFSNIFLNFNFNSREIYKLFLLFTVQYRYNQLFFVPWTTSRRISTGQFIKIARVAERKRTRIHRIFHIKLDGFLHQSRTNRRFHLLLFQYSIHWPGRNRDFSIFSSQQIRISIFSLIRLTIFRRNFRIFNGIFNSDDVLFTNFNRFHTRLTPTWTTIAIFQWSFRSIAQHFNAPVDYQTISRYFSIARPCEQQFYAHLLFFS